MTDHDAILRAIIEEPDDYAHRLVYADWLEEHGRTEAELARAEFIRIQCAENWHRWFEDEEVQELRDRAHELRLMHGEEWLEPFGLRGRSRSATGRRGEEQ